jgi:hypothetical protein
MGGERPTFGRGFHRGGELAFVLESERDAGSAPLLEALLELRSGDGSPAVRDASDRLVRQHAPWALDLDALGRELIKAAGTQRDQRLFRSWSLNPEPAPFAGLAAREGIPRRQVNKLVRCAESRVRRALTTAPAPLPWLVSALRSRLGAVAPAEQLSAELDRLGAREAPVGELLAWLAGPYLPLKERPAWLSSTKAPVVSRTSACLNEDGGVRRLADVQAELANLEISARNFQPWLQANGAVLVHELAVSAKGSLADVVERLLDAHGEARTPEDIRGEIAAGGRQVDALDLARVFGDRRRFTKSSRGNVGLVSWGQKRDRARAKSRPAAANSAKRSLAGRRRSPEAAGGASGSGERLWLWVRVDAEVLRGCEAAVPVALVEGLGLPPLTRRTFASRWGPVTLAYDVPQPRRGPVRAVALAAGARPDDTLLLGFSPRDHLDVEVRHGSGQVPQAEESTKDVSIFPEIIGGGVQ